MMQVVACETMRLWLDGTTTGAYSVNDAIADVSLMSGHAAPPNVAFIASVYSDDRCARWDDPPAFPALYIAPDGLATVEAEVATHTRDGITPVTVRLLLRKAESAESARDAAYIIGAVHRSMRRYLADDAAGRAARTSADHMVLVGKTSTYGPWREAVGDSVAAAIFAIDLWIRNEQP